MKATFQEQQRSLFRDLYLRRFFDPNTPKNPIERVTKFQKKLHTMKFHKNSSLQPYITKADYLNDRLDQFQTYNSRQKNQRFGGSRSSDYWNQNYERNINPENLPVSGSLSLQKKHKNFDNTETNRSQTADISKICENARKPTSKSQISKRVIIGGHDLQKQGKQYQKKAKELQKKAKLIHQMQMKEVRQNKNKQFTKKRFYFRYQLRNVVKPSQKNITNSKPYIYDKKTPQNRTQRFEEIIDLRPWAVFEHQFF